MEPTFQTLVGAQRGTNNFGLGALDSIGETERSTLYVAIKPKFTAEYALSDSELYGGFSFVAATTTLDGEISDRLPDQEIKLLILIMLILVGEKVSLIFH